MEAYFHSDPRIEEWVDQITETIFTVCLLSGVDAEVEFQKGCQIVTKVTCLLQGISIFPSEYLEDGLKQLLEQQLPDSRVINNFPTFQETMNKMVREGMTRATDIPNNSSEITLDDEFITERVVPALASVNGATSTHREAEVDVDVQTHIFDGVMANIHDNSSVIDSSLPSSIPTKPYGIIRKTQVPEQADRLKYVLSNIFPNVPVCWNFNLMGHSFLAQVEDILIFQLEPEQPCHLEKLNKEGWKVYVCSSNDLMFPRRLERGIRQIQRLGK